MNLSLSEIKDTKTAVTTDISLLLQRHRVRTKKGSDPQTQIDTNTQLPVGCEGSVPEAAAELIMW